MTSSGEVGIVRGVDCQKGSAVLGLLFSLDVNEWTFGGGASMSVCEIHVEEKIAAAGALSFKVKSE